MNLFLSIWHCSLSFFGCSLNILLAYVAIFKSPKAIRSYATLIINFAITDFVECALDWFLQARIIPVPGDVTVTYIMNGACNYISPFACQFGLSLFFHCFTHSVWSLLLSFGYRYYILHHDALSRITLLKIIVLIYMPSLIQAITFWMALVPQKQILPLLKNKFPSYDFDSETGVITGVVDVTNWMAAFGVLHLCLPIFPVYTIIFVLRYKIVKHLNENTQMMSPETKAAHSQLLTALTLQAYLPAFMGVSITAYILLQSGVISSIIVEHCLFVFLILMPTLAPLTYLCFVRPYRHFITGLLKRSAFQRVTSSMMENTKTGKFDSGCQNSQLPPQASARY